MPSLDALVESDIEISAVVTNPDRPAGRGMELRHSPVKVAALAAGLDVLQPQRVRDDDFHQRLGALAPDVCSVVAYGKILPPSLLALPKRGFVNLHFSLLPAYRGAAPVQRAIMAGEPTTGVSIMVLTEGMDEGPVLAQAKESIDDTDTAGTLGERLATRGARLLVETLAGYCSDEVTATEQDRERATYAPKITTEEARIAWADPARLVSGKVRALNPVPGAWTTLRGKRVKVWAVSPAAEPELAPGEVAEREDGLVAGAGAGSLSLDSIQLEGKKAMSGSEARRGLRLAAGERFE